MHRLSASLLYLASTLLVFTGPLAKDALGAPVLTVVPSHETVAPGSQAELQLVLLNPNATPAEYPAEDSLDAVLHMGDEVWQVELVAQEPVPSFVPASGFASRKFAFTLPETINGQLVVELSESWLPLTRTVLDVSTSAGFALVEAARGEDSLEQQPVPPPAIDSIGATFADRLTPFEAVYLLYGSGDPSAKFQFSFKYRLLTLGQMGLFEIPPTVQFGYTQRSLWEIGQDSNPFYDSSYLPGVFVEILAPRDKGSKGFNWLGVQAGYLHESNGREADFSRSLNTLFLRSSLALGNLDGWHLLISPQLHTYIFGLEENPDLPMYRGYGQIKVVIGKSDGAALAATAMMGKDWDKTTIQLDLTVPVRPGFLDFEIYLMAQYFNGYGESLLAYDQKSDMLRFGFAFVR